MVVRFPIDEHEAAPPVDPPMATMRGSTASPSSSPHATDDGVADVAPVPLRPS
jgi:hypothetical protein